MKSSSIIKIVFGMVIVGVCLLAIVGLRVYRTHCDLLGAVGFRTNAKTEIGSGVYLYRTSGQDVMLGDGDGVGLLDGSIQKYKRVDTLVFVAYRKRGESEIRFGCYDAARKSFREASADEVDARGWHRCSD